MTVLYCVLLSVWMLYTTEILKCIMLYSASWERRVGVSEEGRALGSEGDIDYLESLFIFHCRNETFTVHHCE